MAELVIVPHYRELPRFVRRVRAGGLPLLRQLEALVRCAIADEERLARTYIQDEDWKHLVNQ